jgi:1,4-dihydroxy-6-naphthoate synthase
MADDRPVLQIGHSADPDDAFMWWALTGESADPPADFDTGRFRYEPVPADLESLNCRAEEGELEITALSCAQYPRVARLYALTTCGTSISMECGPKIVARQAMSADDLHQPGVTLAVPGERTSAFAAANILLGPGEFRHEVVSSDRIIPAVVAGEFDAGLVIHEAQLTFEEAGLHQVADLGMWWMSRSGLPLPLGVNAIRRDLNDLHGPGTLERVTADLKRCLQFALDHRRDALTHALRYGRDLTPRLAERFVSMYVNRWTLDLGAFGRATVRTFLDEAHRAGLVPDPGDVDFVG